MRGPLESCHPGRGAGQRVSGGGPPGGARRPERARMTASPRLPTIGAPPSVRVRVGHALRAALVAGQMRPGEIHSAPVLAARFGVSATPVREAMLDLVKEGLV